MSLEHSKHLQALYPLGELVSERRKQKSLSLAGVAKLVQDAARKEHQYCGATRQTISAIERGERIPHPDGLRWLAIALDLPLDLVVHAAEQQRMNRRHLLQNAALLGGALLLPEGPPSEGVGLPRTERGSLLNILSRVEPDEAVDYLYRSFRQFVRGDNLFGSAHLLEGVTAYHALIGGLLRHASGQYRMSLLNLRARYAEFAGWLCQDAGNVGLAAAWSDRAVEWAQEAGDAGMVAYVLMRKSNLASEGGDAARAIGLAQAAQREPAVTMRGRALALRQEALGHALAGEEAACHRCLDRALEQVGRANGEDGPGSYCNAAYIEIHRAMCWAVLGKPRRAVDLFQRELATLPHTFYRDRGVYLAWLSVAHADSGDPIQATATAWEALEVARLTASRRILQELSRLAPKLGAHRRLPGTKQLLKQLNRYQLSQYRPSSS